MVNSHFLHGSGSERVIFLNGWFELKENWLPVLTHIDERRFSIACMDYRGYGQMRDSDGPFTLAQIAEDVFDLADHLGWSCFSLVGHSMGGMAMQKALSIQPERIDKLVGIAPVPANGIQFDPETLVHFRRAVYDIDLRKDILKSSVSGRLTATWVERKAESSWMHIAQQAFGGYLEEWTEQDISPTLSRANQSVVCIIGDCDPGISNDLMQQTFAKWFVRTSVEVIQGAGHYPMEETPIALAHLIEKSLVR